jgi:uncharacterized 2Fe-2S/4Fe-4S cluster protein (DUF4445 family)
MKQEQKITFEPSGRAVFVLPGTLLLEAAARAGLILQSPCGGKGTCGKCAVRVTHGACTPTPACEKHFSPAQIQKGMRLACQARVETACVVEVPATSLFDSRSKILTTATGRHLPLKPAVWKKHVALPPPTVESPEADLTRLEAAAGKAEVSLELIQRLPELLRANGFRGTAVGRDGKLVDFEPGDTTGVLYGVAFDLGTTTIVGTLMDLRDGRELGVAAGINPQVALGDDVISRISRVREKATALAELQSLAVGALNQILAELVRQAGIGRDDLYCITLAGNTTMQHLVCGITPAALGEIPFAPAVHRAVRCRADRLGLDVHPHARLYVFPNIGGFVGGDTVAGVLASNLWGVKAPTLLVDIGTNGEIVLAHAGQLLACSTAAGPAFEGARISAGMRATDGAIEKVVMNGGDLAYNVINNSAPAGLCGTALIDLVAELLRLGVIDSSGRILPPDEMPAAVPAAVRTRLQPDGDQMRVVLAPAAASRTGEDLCLRQRDVRELQLAAAAIRAGIVLLLRRAGLAPTDLGSVLLAGGFGNFIRRNNARRIGLLPPIPTERIRFVGNTSLMGAKAALLSVDERREAERIAEATRHLDLSQDPEFQMEFSEAMLFPDDEAGTSG